MKKEKTVKSYQRRTKSGKVITVRQHTAKYEASDKKEASRKDGAGTELGNKKFKILDKMWRDMVDGMSDSALYNSLYTHDYLDSSLAEQYSDLKHFSDYIRLPENKRTKRMSKTLRDDIKKILSVEYKLNPSLEDTLKSVKEFSMSFDERVKLGNSRMKQWMKELDEAVFKKNSSRKPSKFNNQSILNQEIATWVNSPSSPSGKESKYKVAKLLKDKESQGYKLTKREKEFLDTLHRYV